MLIVIFSGCNNVKKKDVSGKTTEIPKHSESNDTVFLKCCSNYIVGYSLSQNEYNKLDTINKDEYDENYSDFMYNLEQYSSKIDTSNIKIKISSSRFFKFKNKLIDKKSINTDFGLLFINRKGEFYINKDGLLESEIKQISDSMFALSAKSK